MLIFMFGCEKIENKENNLKYIQTIKGGCALKEPKSIKSTPTTLKDTLIFTIANGNLDFFVGFHGNCCSTYNPSLTIKHDTIQIYIKALKIVLCNCYCYYTYDFEFSGITEPYNYVVDIDDYSTFRGLIKP